MINLYLKWLPFEGELELVRYEEYNPPAGNQVALDFSPSPTGDYVPPSGGQVSLEFADFVQKPSGEDQYVFPAGYDSGNTFGESWVKLHTRYLVPMPIPATLTFGGQKIHNYWTFARPPGLDASSYGTKAIVKNVNRYYQLSGFDSSAFGQPGIKNWIKQAWPNGIKQDGYGRPKIWNLLQIRKLSGFNASAYGHPFLRGGVKYVYVSGRHLATYGKPSVINTTADQFIRLNNQGIKPQPVGYLTVSPRMLYPAGIHGTGISEPLVQFPPYPKGWESSRTGRPAIEYWTKWLFPAGVSPAELMGYPKIRDRAQFTLVPSILGNGIFGDIIVANKSLFISVQGANFFESSDFSEVRSNRRTVESRGFDALAVGNSEARNKTPSFRPDGIPAPAIGHSAIGYSIRYIYGRGWHYSGYGRPVITKTPSLYPKWTEGLIPGNPTVWRRVRSYDIAGIPSQEFGGSTVWFRIRRIPIEGKFQGGAGKPKIEHSVRHMALLGDVHSRYGRPAISNLDRIIYPEGYFKEFAVVHMVGGTRWLKAFGFDAASFGNRIIPESQTLLPRGFSALYGLPLVWNQTQLLTPAGITTGLEPADRWGKAKVYNLRQHIELYFFEESELNPPGWSRWTKIENRTKEFGVTGQAMDKHGQPSVFNNARLLQPGGILAPSKPDYYEAGMVSFFRRELPVQGMEAPYISTWGRIYNDAFVAAPRGFSAGLFGKAEVEKTRRYFDRIGGFLTERVGGPMIAFRIREIQFEPRYSIAPPRINLHRVDLYTRYVTGIGEVLSGTGLPSLSIHFNKITTRWTHQERFGWADLHNVTPELRTRGRSSDEFGVAFTRLEWRPVKADGGEMQRFGRTTIADRDRKITVRGLDAGALGDKLRVIKGGQPPYTEQFIFLKDHGIEQPSGNFQVPSPSLNQYVLYTKGRNSEDFGTAFLQSNALIVDYGIKNDGYGKPTLGLKDRKVFVGVGHDHYAEGKPRITPHTIWARPAPAQARRNHPPNPFRPVGQTSIYGPGERFGKQRISTWRGEVYPRTAGNEAAYGHPRIQLHLRFIEVSGIRSYRVGWHKLGDGTQAIVQFASKNFAAFGKPAIERPPYTGPQYIKKGSINAQLMGAHRVEFFNREVFAQGHNMLRVGSRKSGDSPYMWQGLRVGPLMPTIAGGLSASEYGEPWVSFRVRGVEVDGFSTFASEYDLENFAERMRVRNAYAPVPNAQAIKPVGMDLFRPAVPNIQLAARFIKPDGNANQYRKGAF